MTLLVGLVLRSSVVLAIGLIGVALLRRRSAALRHVVLAATLLAAALVGPLAQAAPRWHLPAALQPGRLENAAAVTRLTDVVLVTGRSSPAIPRVSPWPAIAIWIGGSGIVLMILGLGLLRMRRLTAAAEIASSGRWAELSREVSAELGVRRPVRIIRSTTPALLATWGWRRPEIIVPAAAASWTDDTIRSALYHELEHVRRRDWAVHMTAEFVCAVYWFNPLVWLVRSRLRRESELACDDAVLRAGVAPAAYATQLSHLARAFRAALVAVPTMPMARSSSLTRRIAAMLNPNLDRRPLTTPAAAWAVALLLGLSLPIAAVGLPQDSPAPLSGAVYDMSGSVMPDVDLTLEREGHATLETRSDPAGHFSFPDVAPGAYVLQATLAGFRTLRYELTLKDVRDWTQVLTLQVGEVVETISVEANREAPSTPDASTPVRLKVGGNIRPPTKIKDVHPVYPESMKKAGQQGVVILAAVIGRDGSVISLHVLSAHIHPDLAAAAVEAVRQWRFEPTLLNGAPVEVAMTVTVNFTLAD